jgi:hypothetical protein
VGWHEIAKDVNHFGCGILSFNNIIFEEKRALSPITKLPLHGAKMDQDAYPLISDIRFLIFCENYQYFKHQMCYAKVQKIHNPLNNDGLRLIPPHFI